MIGSIFTPKYILIVAVLFAISSVVSISLSRQQTSSPQGMGNDQPQSGDSAFAASRAGISYDAAIDSALEYAVNGNHSDAVSILRPLAEQGVVRAKLYLATAYYHGNGIAKDREKARSLFFELQQANYEPHIVNTYLSLLGSPH